MNNLIKSEVNQIELIKQELVSDGYQVVVEPSTKELPFDLGQYRPGLIATKDDGGIIIEIKPSLNRLPVEPFQKIAEQIAMHRGWRFVLVTLDDENEVVLATNKLPSWYELTNKVNKLNRLIQESLFEPALLFLWSILEAAFRKRSIEQHIPIERFPISTLLNHIYSNGEISITEFDLFKDCLMLRDKIAHGMFVPVELDSVKEATDRLNVLLNQWSKRA